ncbi:MAG: F0F1 ATP synthase subunit A [Oscillospiraceae bacterium]|jgi:F-type H+-transporting ATPase subunit a|nr:F0F1 ATP synthase subunit A [Oscillospiraceae bacterium]
MTKKRLFLLVFFAFVIVGFVISLQLPGPEPFGVDGPRKSIVLKDSSGNAIKDPLTGVDFIISESVIMQIPVMVFLIALFIFLGHNLKVRPESKRQAAAEWIVTFFRNTVEETMGPKYTRGMTPYIASLFLFSMCSSLQGVLGLRSPNSDLFVVLTWGLTTFIMVQANKFRTGGVGGFLKSWVQPVPVMLPFNLIGDPAAAVSITLRQFGNIMGGCVITGLIYFALANARLSVGVPAVLSLYFDFFAAVVQAYIFIMLTMCYIGGADCTPEES